MGEGDRVIDSSPTYLPRTRGAREGNVLTVFGSVAVGAMFLFYWLEHRSPWFILLFAIACAASSAYGFLIESYPFGVIEALWALVALQRFSSQHRWGRLEP
jgi:hypothetical protein